jgi:hypothetical protein
MQRLYQPQRYYGIVLYVPGTQSIAAFVLLLSSFLSAQNTQPKIVDISPTSGAEGIRVKIRGNNLQETSAVLFGTARSDFKVIATDVILALVPHKAMTSAITVVTRRGRATTAFPFTVINDPRIPDEVSYKSGYVNSVGRPGDFQSARLWGIAIADSRVKGFGSAKVEIAWSQLSCRADEIETTLNEDTGSVHGGLFMRQPWFGGQNYHEPMPLDYNLRSHSVVLHVGRRIDRVWHFWSPSPRTALPAGSIAGCTARARVRISQGALLQMGFDYWRSPTVPYGLGGNNHEAGASNWYFPSLRWQEATFSDIGGPEF